MISTIRHDWDASNTIIKPFNQGLTNKIVGLFNSRCPNDESQAIIVKIYGFQTELFIDREEEIEAMIKLVEHDVLKQKCLIRFNNGIIYEYAPGRPCSRDDIRNENISGLIAEKMAELHQVPINKCARPFIVGYLPKLIDLLKQKHVPNEAWCHLANDVDQILHTILPRMLSNTKFGKEIVFGHNDLHAPNIILNESHGTVSFIDFEYAHVNYAAADIANHFVGYKTVGKVETDSHPKNDEQKRWLSTYLRKRGMDETMSNDETCLLINQFSAIIHLMWGLWGLLQSHISTLNYDYLGHTNIHFAYYGYLRVLLFS